ncbi:thioesterase II family protein [Kitasatospora viridis]|uniref:Surfactin synthase thioesterase subunit n=1 Tax=Kitasatospora viridis TaxID=281105 RepID=A0A561UJU0_9ACTN|nr:alpha/beta fold hydrolase [Kitasatospora viridis]TWF99632.1 surfactin synthase thioesterase subunit [Kitasatospora viridis]
MSPFVRPRQLDRPTLRLIGFHHAGGSAAGYYPLTHRLPEGWELLLLDLPGRGKRHAEPPLTEMTAVIARAVADVQPWTDAPFALFGHSLGALVAVETARELERIGAPPVWVGVSARVAPAFHPQAGRGLAELDDAELLTELIALGGLPDRIHELPGFVERFLRTSRADLRAVESYRPHPDRAPLTCPVTAFGGIDDPWAPADLLTAWSRETTGGFRRHVMPGGHFYLLGDAFAGFAAQLIDDVEEMGAALTH